MKIKILTILFVLLNYSAVFSQSPGLLWAKSNGGYDIDVANSITCDESGNFYMTGAFLDSTLTFDSITLNNTDSGGMLFVAKYNSSGNVLWAKNASSRSGGASIVSDKKGSIVVCGSYPLYDMTIGGVTLINAGGSDMFIAKYDTLGNVIWAKGAGGPNDDSATRMAIDTLGNIYVTGYFIGTISFGTVTLSSGEFISVFTAKYDQYGNLLWAKGSAGAYTESSSATGVSTDAAGNCYVTGYFGGSPITFGSITLTSPGSYIVKYDPMGNVLWARSADVATTGICTDATGNSYVTGYFNSPTISFGTLIAANQGYMDIFIVKYDPMGNAVWLKTDGGPVNEYGTAISRTTDGSLLVAGVYNGPSISFGSPSAVIVGSGNLFVSKFDTTGTMLWAMRNPGGSGNQPTAVCDDLNGGIYLAGIFGGPITFGSTTLPNAGSTDFFYLRMCQMQTPVITSSSSFNFCQGSSLILSASTGNTYLWNTGDTTQTLLVEEEGNYSVMETDGNGCSANSASAIVTMDSLPAFINASGPTTFCQGNNVTLTAGTGYLYTWSTGATTPSITAALSGTYSAIVSNSCGTDTTANITVVVNPLPTVTAFATSTNICEGTMTSLTATGANTYTWSGGITSGTYISPTGTITYYVWGTDVNNCSSSDGILITVIPLPDTSVSISGGTITADQNGAAYQWLNCSSNFLISGATNQSYSAPLSGNYAVIITMNGCSDTSDCISIFSVGLNEIFSDQFVVYPNPSSGIFSINSSTFVSKIEVVNVLGEKVYSLDNLIFKNADQKIDIDLSRQPNGIYFVQLSSEKGSFTKKISINK